MTEENRSRRPSSARPRRTPRTGTAAAGAGAGQVAELSEPSLGDVSFDEWFETPVFESDPDERLEELATSRRGPLRLAASTFLRLNARASQVRRRTDDAEILGADALRAVDPVPVFEEVEPPPVPRRTGGSRSAGAARSAPANGKAAAATNGNRNGKATGTGKASVNGKTTGKAAAAAPRKAAGRPVSSGAAPARKPVPVNGKPTPSARKAAGGRPSAVTATPPPGALEGAGAAGESVAPPLRQRLAEALDRWAEREAATQIRLERMILPKRWQA